MAVSNRPSREEMIRNQVEYYLCDANLQRDPFFRNLVLSNPEGWIDADESVLTAPMIKRKSVDRTELAAALRTSIELVLDAQYHAGNCTSCRIRRVRPYVFDLTQLDVETAQDGKGKGKGKDSRVSGYTIEEHLEQLDGKANGKGYINDHSEGGKAKGKGSKGKNRGIGPEFDPSTPCGYYMAGYCRHGDRCNLQHSVYYALSVRNEWLNPSDRAAKERLQTAAEQGLTAEGVASANLFPRVFSHELRAKVKKRDHWSADTQWDTNTQHSPLRYLVVLDLEGKDEIIELPALIIDIYEKRELGRFQRYVRPAQLFQGHELSPDSPATHFTRVLRELDEWLTATIQRSLQDFGSHSSDTAFLTCGDWDCNHIHTQCGISGIKTPQAFKQWVNIKRSYSDHYGGDFRGMKSMLARLRLLDAQGNPKYGFHHLGMHDVENIGRCAMHLLEEGLSISINGSRRTP